MASIDEIFKGLTNEEAGDKLIYVMREINAMDLTQEQDFGELYEYLIDEFGLRAGKSGGEFYTPECLGDLLFKICHSLFLKRSNKAPKVYDPTCGVGSLLAKFKNVASEVCGQEINRRSYAFAKFNMLANGVKNFRFAHGDTLMKDHFKDEQFDIVVANYPYGIRWDDKKADPERFRFGIPPGSKADYAFIQHMLNKLAPGGICVTLCFPGIMFRENKEGDIRRNLIKAGHVMAVIDLSDNLFFGASIAASILVLSKEPVKDILFMNAREASEKRVKMNTLPKGSILAILEILSQPLSAGMSGDDGRIRWIVKTTEEVLDPKGANGCLCVGNHVPARVEEEPEFIPEEQSRKITLDVLKILKVGYEIDQIAKEFFGHTCPETEELNEVLRKHVKPLWEKYLTEN